METFMIVLSTTTTKVARAMTMVKSRAFVTIGCSPRGWERLRG
jgi:hypothetical protein